MIETKPSITPESYFLRTLVASSQPGLLVGRPSSTVDGDLTLRYSHFDEN
jgi:hypothetical protein